MRIRNYGLEICPIFSIPESAVARIRSVFGEGIAVFDYGNASRVLLKVGGNIIGAIWNTRACGMCGCCWNSHMEKKYIVKHSNWDSSVYAIYTSNNLMMLGLIGILILDIYGFNKDYKKYSEIKGAGRSLWSYVWKREDRLQMTTD